MKMLVIFSYIAFACLLFVALVVAIEPSYATQFDRATTARLLAIYLAALVVSALVILSDEG